MIHAAEGSRTIAATICLFLATVLTVALGSAGIVAAACSCSTSADGDTSLGLFAFGAITPPGSVTAIGFSALYQNTIGGNSNTAVGFEALLDNTTAKDNTAVGFEALFTNSTGVLNTAIGAYALKVNNGDNNTATGQAPFSATPRAVTIPPPDRVPCQQHYGQLQHRHRT